MFRTGSCEGTFVSNGMVPSFAERPPSCRSLGQVRSNLLGSKHF
jgi:hypothetical protein